MHLVIWHSRLAEDVKGIEVQLNERMGEEKPFNRMNRTRPNETRCVLWWLMVNVRRWCRRTELQHRGWPESAVAISHSGRSTRPSQSSPSLPVRSLSPSPCHPTPALSPPPATATARLLHMTHSWIIQNDIQNQGFQTLNLLIHPKKWVSNLVKCVIPVIPLLTHLFCSLQCLLCQCKGIEEPRGRKAASQTAGRQEFR